MTSYRYLGYGVTDSNGVAHLKKNAKDQDIDGYTGVGAGEIDIIASLDNPIVDGSIVSVPCNVLDCYKYDEGLLAEGHHNDIWTGIYYYKRKNSWNNCNYHIYWYSID